MSRGVRKTMVAMLLGSAVTFVFSCSGDASEGHRAEPDPARPAPARTSELESRYHVIELEDGGSIAGAVRWMGDRPDVDVLPVRTATATCGVEQPSRALRVSERGGVRDAVVSLVHVREGRAFEPPEEPLTFRRVGCRYEPHVAVTGVGHPVRFANDDDVLHNAHGLLGDDTVIDLGLPAAGSEAQRAVERAGMVRLLCDAGHSWEQAWLLVSEHPYATTTDEEGRFRLSDVPPGQYTLRVWHEGWRVLGSRSGRPRYSSPVVLTRTVSVSPRQETTLDFELSQQSAELAGD